MTDLTEIPDNDADTRSSGKMTATAYMSMLALAFSFLALLVSLYEALAIRAEQKADVWPYLSIRESYNEKGYSVLVSNKGVGPARINGLSMTLNGKPYTDIDSAIRATLGDEQAFSYELYRTSAVDSGVMSADETAVFFSVPWEARTRKLAEIWTKDGDLSICYCSIYDDCWRASKQSSEPVAVNSCKAE